MTNTESKISAMAAAALAPNASDDEKEAYLSALDEIHRGFTPDTATSTYEAICKAIEAADASSVDYTETELVVQALGAALEIIAPGAFGFYCVNGQWPTPSQARAWAATNAELWGAR